MGPTPPPPTAVFGLYSDNALVLCSWCLLQWLCSLAVFAGRKKIRELTAESYTDASFGEMAPDWLRRAKEHLETNLTHMYTDLELKGRKGECVKKLHNIMQLFDEANLPELGPARIGVLGKTF